MSADCDQRTLRLIERRIVEHFRATRGAVYSLQLLSVKHDDERVIVKGLLQDRPFQEEMWFVVTLPRVDEPLDYFL
jgi:hypothetical protein